MSGWRVGVDVGGTFTDIALVEESTGRVGVYKVPTTVDDPVSGVLDGVREGLRGEGLDPADVVYFGAGSTLAVNTIIQRTGVPTGLLITEGFRDVLEIRRTRLPDAPSFEAARPVPLVRRAHVREVRGRIDALPRPGLTFASSNEPPADWPLVALFPTFEALEERLGQPVRPYQLLLSPAADDGFVRDWRPRAMTPERHVGYAIQWFSFAGVLAVMGAVLGLRTRRR